MPRYSRISTGFGALRHLLPSFPAAEPSGVPTVGTPLNERRTTAMAIYGTVKSCNADKGNGFIPTAERGTTALAYITAVEKAGLPTRRQDHRVTFEHQEEGRGTWRER